MSQTISKFKNGKSGGLNEHQQLTSRLRDVRGPFRTNNPKNIFRNISYDNSSHFWDTFSKNHIRSTSYIQKKTQNPNTVFKILVYNTKYTNNAKTLSTKKQKYFENFEQRINTTRFSSFYFILCIICIIHIS